MNYEFNLNLHNYNVNKIIYNNWKFDLNPKLKYWEDFWEKVAFLPLIKHPHPDMYGGTSSEPLASMGMAAFLDADRERFIEGYSVLDYGCGAGILANFLSERLEDFSYYGLEPRQCRNRIEYGKSQLGNDPRIFMGIIEEDFKTIITKELNSIILISIFTHLELPDIYNILDNLQEGFKNNADLKIIFSCFINDSLFLDRSQPHIWERYWHNSWIRESDLVYYCNINNLKLRKHIEFIAGGGYVHHIYEISGGKGIPQTIDHVANYKYPNPWPKYSYFSYVWEK